MIAAAVAAAALAAPSGALAADPPAILTAGINAQDQLYATYAVAPGTEFDFIEFATVPDNDPTSPIFFADGNFAAFCSSESPSATCGPTAYIAQYPRPRDRRYFARVSAKVTGTATYLTSTVWVIDDAKPQIAGDAPLGADPPTNKPIAGHPVGTAPPPPPPGGPPPPPPGPPPPPPAPSAALKLLTVPKTIGALLTKGVRIQVGCTVTCSAFGRLDARKPDPRDEDCRHSRSRRGADARREAERRRTQAPARPVTREGQDRRGGIALWWHDEEADQVVHRSPVVVPLAEGPLGVRREVCGAARSARRG